MSGPVSQQLRMILQSLHRAARLTGSEVARMRIDGGEKVDERQEVYLHFVKATQLHMEAFNSLPAARASKSANTLVGGRIFTFLIKR